MAERIPLVYNPSANQIQEVATTDEVSVGIMSASVLSTPSIISEQINLTNTQFNYVHVGPVALSGVGTVTVGAGVTYVVI